MDPTTVYWSPNYPAHDQQLLSVIHAIWYFVSGCMLVLGAIIAWTWLRWRRGAHDLFLPTDLIGVFYVVSGVATVTYTGKPFFWVFVVLGGALLLTARLMRRA
ncbi:MAG: hypothetical protein E6K53_11065 [Gammaproteobacteria bacterium]|nr:MAG: hypothetical protein E6K53_11065 [Gammaproteobacteria bacterium]